VLRENRIDPSLFWGVERHLIAAVLGGWHIARQKSGHLFIDWSESIPSRMAALSAIGVSFSVGLLPRPGYDTPLIPDFLSRAKLDPALGATAATVRNPSFHPVLIEAVVNAIEQGHPMPRPHGDNAFFIQAGAQLDQHAVQDIALLSLLKSHIDTAFEAKNTGLAADLGLSSTYFRPRERISREAIRDAIYREATTRAAASEDVRTRERDQRIAYVLRAWSDYQRNGHVSMQR